MSFTRLLHIHLSERLGNHRRLQGVINEQYDDVPFDDTNADALGYRGNEAGMNSIKEVYIPFKN